MMTVKYDGTKARYYLFGKIRVAKKQYNAIVAILYQLALLNNNKLYVIMLKNNLQEV